MILFFAVALLLTLEPRTPGGVLHVARTQRISFGITLHHSTSDSLVERPEAEFENHQPGYFDQRPGPNVVLRVVRIEGDRRTDVRMRVTGGGSSGSVNTEVQEVEIMIPPADRETRFARMLDCVAEALPQKLSASEMAAFGAYVERGIVDNEPGTYDITATYRPKTWPKSMPAIASTPLRVMVDDGVDGYQQFCDHIKSGAKP